MVQNRLWFNEANDSHYFLVPGLIVLIMTLIGAFLTAMVMAREWERGTLEALFVSDISSEQSEVSWISNDSRVRSGCVSKNRLAQTVKDASGNDAAFSTETPSGTGST